MGKRVFCVLATVFAASLTVVAQSGQTTRQRVVPSPTIKNDEPAAPRSTRPPVLSETVVKPKEQLKSAPKPAPVKVEDEEITVETNLVSTPVSVLDRNNRFIPGLKKGDFKLFENDVEQDLTYFKSEEQPFTVVLMIDISPSTKYRIDEIHGAAISFVNQLRPNDKVMVVAFDENAEVLAEPTSDRRTLYAAIARAQFGNGTSLYDTVAAVSQLELLRKVGRNAVVLFSDGVDSTSFQASAESTVAGVDELDALFYTVRYYTLEDGNVDVGEAAANNIIISPTTMAHLRRVAKIRQDNLGTPQQYEFGRRYLEALAANTGGRMFEADSIVNVEAAFAGVAEELRRQYSLGYYPSSEGKAGERRRVRIQVSRPNVVVRAKSSYVIKQKPEDPTDKGLVSTQTDNR
ncbi:MAG: VWA domain-containing protein [bacterium]|nr:VWA domain-containing protein [bacterium]